MTAQVVDQVRLADDPDPWALVAVQGGDLFLPEAHGFQPFHLHTACWRGWHATYGFAGGALALEELTVRDAHQRYPALGGVTPEVLEGAAVYRGLSLAFPLTGRLLLGRDPLPAAYTGGLAGPAAYRLLREVRLEAGRVVGSDDRSDRAAALRERHQPGGDGGLRRI